LRSSLSTNRWTTCVATSVVDSMTVSFQRGAPAAGGAKGVVNDSICGVSDATTDTGSSSVLASTRWRAFTMRNWSCAGRAVRSDRSGGPRSMPSISSMARRPSTSNTARMWMEPHSATLPSDPPPRGPRVSSRCDATQVATHTRHSAGQHDDNASGIGSCTHIQHFPGVLCQWSKRQHRLADHLSGRVHGELFNKAAPVSNKRGAIIQTSPPKHSHSA